MNKLRERGRNIVTTLEPAYEVKSKNKVGSQITLRLIKIDGEEREISGKLPLRLRDQQYSGEYGDRLKAAREHMKVGDFAIIQLEGGRRMLVRKDKDGELEHLTLKGPAGL